MDKIQEDIIILKSKLTQPRLDETLRRERLDVAFENLKKNKLIAIIAGAGYGKTTLAAQACRRMEMPTVWYRLDSSDNDAVTLMRYLIDGIRQYYPAFGERLLDRIQSIRDLNSAMKSLWTQLLHEMEQVIENHLIIVLDDFYLVQGTDGIREMVNFLLANLPEKVHLLLTSRTALEIDLSSLIVKREASIISERELAFTVDETLMLYRDNFQLSLSDEDLRVLQDKTHGWAAGLILFHFSLDDLKKTQFDQQLNRFTGSSDFFEDYFEENIFKHLPVETSAFLIQTSVLSRLDVELCNQLLGIDNAGEILHQLEKRHLFTFAADKERQTYYYHHLLRDFLRGKFKQHFDLATRRRLYRRIGLCWEERGDLHEAISSYLSAEAFENASKLMIKNGFDMAGKGRLNQVLLYCRQIPDRLMETNLWLMNLLGVTLFQLGKTQESFDVFNKAHELFKSNLDQDGIGFCLNNLAELNVTCGNFAKAEEIFKKVLAYTPRTSKDYSFSLNRLAFITGRMGKLEASDQYRRQSQQNSEGWEETPLGASKYVDSAFQSLWSGDFQRVIQHSEKVWNIAVRFKEHLLMVLSSYLIASACFFRGEYEKGYKRAVQGIRISEKNHFVNTLHSLCHIIAALALVGLEKFAQARAHCEQSLAICGSMQSDWIETYTYAVMCHIQIKLKDLQSAEGFARKALEVIELSNLDAENNYFKLVLAWVLLQRGRLAEANVLVESVQRYQFESKFVQRWAAIFYAKWHWHNGRFKAVTDELKVVMENLQLQANERDYFLIDQQDWVTPFLVEIYAENNFQEQITLLLSNFKKENLNVLKTLSQSDQTGIRSAARGLLKELSANHNADLSIRCFGSFALMRGDFETPAEEWTSGKARTLFKYLALHSGQGFISKDRLLEMLWPDQDPAITTKRLHVALSAIRKILQPELAKGEPSAYVIRQKDTYKLTLGQNGFVDAVLFDQLLAEARAAKDSNKRLALLQVAERLYHGPLFDDDPFCHWCIGLREKYQEKYFKLLTDIADCCELLQDKEKGIEYLRHALEIDDCAEDIYCRLMSLYHQAGNRIMVKKMYETCKSKVELEMECPLSDQTEQLYQNIMS